MPQDFPMLDPDDFPLDEEHERQYSSLDNLCEQLGLDCGVEDNQGSKEFYSSEDIKAGKQLLKILRDSVLPLTQLQMATKVYPKVFDHNQILYCDKYNKNWSITKLIQQKYVESVGRQLRGITHQINQSLDKIENEKEQLLFLQKVSLAIQIGADSKGRAMYVYHGPEAPQQLEGLQLFRDWARTHQAKNSRLLRLAEKTYASAVNPLGVQLDPNDFPGEEFDQQLDLGFDSF